jgi:uncharacterized protein (TIGR00255 family)
VRAAVRAAIARGSVTVVIRLDRATGAAVRVDLDAAKQVYADLAGLARALYGDAAAPVSLDLVCAQPGVLVPGEPDDDAGQRAEREWVSRAVEQAVADLVRMREAEGSALALDLDGRLHRLGELVAEIATLAAAAPEDARRRFGERLGRLLSKAPVDAAEFDPGRLAQEVAVLADRLDVTEELVRLRSHISQLGAMMREATQSRAPVGRRLDFLVQEIGREVNTVASKSQSADIARLVVETKAEVEKIREQVQNIE